MTNKTKDEVREAIDYLEKGLKSKCDLNCYKTEIQTLITFAQSHLGEDVGVKEIKRIITGYGQLTSKYPDKQNLLAGQNTFISCSQYDDLAAALSKEFEIKRKTKD